MSPQPGTPLSSDSYVAFSALFPAVSRAPQFVGLLPFQASLGRSPPAEATSLNAFMLVLIGDAGFPSFSFHVRCIVPPRVSDDNSVAPSEIDSGCAASATERESVRSYPCCGTGGSASERSLLRISASQPWSVRRPRLDTGRVSSRAQLDGA